jgi:hemerythrin-like domain-containing protein
MYRLTNTKIVTALTGVIILAAACSRPAAGPGVGSAARDEAAAAPVSPNEDLMQEHALLDRVLLIYEEIGRRLQSADRPDPDVLAQAAGTIRRFIEQYHEKLEEDNVFPRFEGPGPLAELVKTLRVQHAAGRAMTERIIARATASAFSDPAERKGLQDDVLAFIRMYRPHAAREGSVLFPAFRELLPAKEFLDLGDRFEAKEHEVLGPEGFEGQVTRVAELERRLGINEMGRFTPSK